MLAEEIRRGWYGRLSFIYSENKSAGGGCNPADCHGIKKSCPEIFCSMEIPHLAGTGNSFASPDACSGLLECGRDPCPGSFFHQNTADESAAGDWDGRICRSRNSRNTTRSTAISRHSGNFTGSSSAAITRESEHRKYRDGFCIRPVDFDGTCSKACSGNMGGGSAVPGSEKSIGDAFCRKSTSPLEYAELEPLAGTGISKDL